MQFLRTSTVLALAALATAAQQSSDPDPRRGDVLPLTGPSAQSAHSLLDQARPGAFLRASSAPTLGQLYPLSDAFSIDPDGRVGIGTATPSEKLHIWNHGSSPEQMALRIDTDSPNGWGLAATNWDTTVVNLGIQGISRCPVGTGIQGAVMGNQYSFLNGSGVSGSTIAATGPRTAGVFGQALDATRPDYGILGLTASSSTGIGVYGEHTSDGGEGAGVEGVTRSGATLAIGVRGRVLNVNAGPYSSAIQGLNSSLTAEGIGVYGSHSGAGWGVYGRTTGAGIGVHGYSQGGGDAIFATGTLAASGAKSFVQPHPTDPSKEVRFVCLEGNESGTYFRGSSRLEYGRVVIDVPEEFQLVSEEDGLTVQLTPVGMPVMLWIESKDLDRIVVRGDVDCDFDYFVNGVRRGFREHEPIRANRAFVPQVRGEAYGQQYPAELRAILVENGILNADFTPNEETAAQQGWTLIQASQTPEARAALEVEPIRPERRFADELEGPRPDGLIRDRSGSARKR